MVHACGSLVIPYHFHGYLHGLTMVSFVPFNFLESNDVVGSPFGFLTGSMLGPYIISITPYCY